MNEFLTLITLSLESNSNVILFFSFGLQVSLELHHYVFALNGREAQSGENIPDVNGIRN